MDAVITQITANKPDLKQSTALGYAKSLQTIKNRLADKKTPLSPEIFMDTDATINAIKDMKPANKKNMATALKALHPSLYDEFCKQCCELNKLDYESNEHRQQSKTKNEMDAAEIEIIRDRLHKGFLNAIKQLKISTALLHQHLQDMQQWILFSLYFTDGLAPRRALDYLQMKFRNHTPDENYVDLKRKLFIYNHYKTSRLRGQQQNYVPDKLLKAIKTYIKYIPDGTDTLLFRLNGHRLETSSEMTTKLNDIFGAGKGINAIRHHYLTTKYADTVKNYESLCDDMIDMGSSVASVRSYIIE